MEALPTGRIGGGSRHPRHIPAMPASGLPPASSAECDTPTDFRDT
jgi:hypothetical protein